jgi:hypothetical protein
VQTLNLLPGEREPTEAELQSGVVVTVEYVKWIGQELFRVVLQPGQTDAAIAAVRTRWEGQRFTGPIGDFTFNDIDAHLVVEQIMHASVVPDVHVITAADPATSQSA